MTDAPSLGPRPSPHGGAARKKRGGDVGTLWGSGMPAILLFPAARTFLGQARQPPLPRPRSSGQQVGCKLSRDGLLPASSKCAKNVALPLGGGRREGQGRKVEEGLHS